ncbi:MAG: 1-deoxy-D-xylulose-5-phosphate reductoisomerase [Sphingomonadaceae bacterium]|uniref:1-deoxy-D-xylulose-5-phosphate reductoisomerase n=1 Tax=Thermaurantiacus sp. TaxID=2820283 RepID=UPI00298F1738|nr:1-deoxy-D-xylulose-5-phosphate reductoisomerase [Thermaurantiacus sp.]MCS6986543.1 1-deoxy-D-xylulose-5-phosphate reductoisomerase [Sphingomonadaceae bacterium]MDW8414196.1 1-deoxy-D-xylulose-5-phosphate reductoisomerase [Thermaurantiacus sp.]
MKTVTVLGATGSIGASTLDLVARNPDRFRLHAVTAGRDWERLAELARTHGARVAVIAEESHYERLAEALSGSGVEARAGAAALAQTAAEPVDLVVAAIVGAAGLAPTLAALEAGTTVALANKEALICAGELMTAAAARSGARILPIDSEHNAIFQVLEDVERIARIVLTASGGPFRTLSLNEMARVTPEQAVRHPNWSMGAKISVDSATLMNKGLELIEAHHLFGVAPDRLGVLVHPQSLVHGLVEYVDGSVLAQMGPADMRVPIAHALAWPERMPTPVDRLCLATAGRLDFEEPDRTRFPALALAEAALAAGGCRPCALSAANEVAVGAFLEGRIGFLDIAAVVEETLAALPPAPVSTLQEVAEVDAAARAAARSFVAHRARR